MPPSSRQKFFPQQQQQQLTDLHRRPGFNVPALAASILYSVMQHLDHWPAPLVKAYADDCFGARSWVDDEACRLLVENLALVHSNLADSDFPGCNSSVEKLSDAKVVAVTYSDFEAVRLVRIDTEGMKEQLDDAAHRRGSLSSNGSLSLSRRQSPPSSNPSRRHKQNGDEESDRASICDLNIKKSHKKQESDSSSGEEDEEVEEVLVTTAKPGTPSRIGGSKLTSEMTSDNTTRCNSSAGCGDVYPLTQSHLNLQRVRQRFFGENLELARAMITKALVERLDARAKQNSGLLQSLPSFVAMPSVREVIANNLEKWLQSPALAGLARSLFFSTVSHMRNTDPPLDADLRAIDSILAMKLKANQVWEFVFVASDHILFW